MEAYELDKIKVLATSFRGAIEIAKDAGEFDNDFAFPRFPKGCCGDTSDLLAEYLVQHDIYTYYVCGQKRYPITRMAGSCKHCNSDN
ncbi:hypothetical protein [Faecalibacterium sp.]|uniref:hypothetical protein n=1 Tax=Faecalibacterium sp. TaxID=1971605 RepID=UPI00399ABEC2